MSTFRIRLAVCLSALFVVAGCSSESSTKEYNLTAEPDYSRGNMWFDAPVDSTVQADVFYIAPTCIWDWEGQDGKTYHHMNVDDAKQRDRVDGSMRLAYGLFGKSCRFYAPYYRQITMQSWMIVREETERRFAIAQDDVARAFNYYMAHFNGGRPFILAGHSQGAKAVIELLKHTLTLVQYDNMVAAYAFGYGASRQELDEYPLLRPARDSIDCGVLVCYNSVSSTKAVSSLVDGNVVCINPLNWRTDTSYASPEQHIGAVFFDGNGMMDTMHHSIGVRIDSDTHALIVDGLDDNAYYIPSIGNLFPKGNYHVQELNLYFLNVQHNIAQRIAAFNLKRSDP